jgi:serine/threonine-protein kinase RsbT
MTAVEHKLIGELKDLVGSILAKSIVTLGVARSKVNLEQVRPGDELVLLNELRKGLQLFVKEPDRREQCLARVDAVLESFEPASPVEKQIKIELMSEADIVRARGAGRDLCRDLGFTGAIQIKVATAISELARNVIQYAGTGRVVLDTVKGKRSGIQVVVQDEGPGIAAIDEIMRGEFSSQSGMGIGIVGTRNLMDDFDIETAPGKGTVITARKYLR